MYAMTGTRPDVTYALRMTSHHQTTLGPEYWKIVKNILRTKNGVLVYGSQTDLIAEGDSDACFMTNPDNRRSQSGYVFLLNSGAVSWHSWKQSTMVNSTTLAED